MWFKFSDFQIILFQNINSTHSENLKHLYMALQAGKEQNICMVFLSAKAVATSLTSE